MYGERRWRGTVQRRWKIEGKKAIRRTKTRAQVVEREIEVEVLGVVVFAGGGIYLVQVDWVWWGERHPWSEMAAGMIYSSFRRRRPVMVTLSLDFRSCLATLLYF